MNAIECEHVSLTIGKTRILQDIHISFEKGRIHGIVGRNGSGKTMLMKCICGFIRPDTGSIIVSGKKLSRSYDFPKDVGFIIETPGFIPYYSGLKNLKILADIQRRADVERIRQVMEQLGLNPNLNRHVKKYSLGMRQRLGLAQAIMEDPDILVLDEPMNGLDKEGVKEMRQYLADFRDQGKTILLASHSMEDIELLCDTIAEMDRGRLERLG